MPPPAPGAPDPLSGRLPVTVITGFLGSGKTTLLRRLLRHPGMSRAAVIINEFGEVGLDHELVEASSEQTTLLSNGCLCCALRTDLQETLRELFAKRRSGEVIDFDRVFVETTGLADPAPVLHTLQSDGLLGAQYRLHGVLTLVDAVNGLSQLDTMPEAAKQAALADRLALTKTDLAPAARIAELEARLRAMNPGAELTHVVDGRLDPASLDTLSPASAAALAREPARWLGGAEPAAAAGGEGAYLGRRLAASAGRHDAAIRTFTLTFDKPLTWEGLTAALELLTRLRGADLLRVKGIVWVRGEPGPIAIQGVQHLFHPPLPLEARPGHDARSRLVFIVRNIPRESVEAAFEAVARLVPAPSGDA